jgi:hypothetical protein
VSKNYRLSEWRTRRRKKRRRRRRKSQQRDGLLRRVEQEVWFKIEEI